MPTCLKIAATAVIALGIHTAIARDVEAVEVCEIANEAAVGVRFSVLRQGEQPRQYFLAPKAATQVSTVKGAQLDLAGGRVALDAEMRYAFRDNGKGQVTLAKVGRRARAATPPNRPSRPSANPPARPITPIPSAGIPLVPSTGGPTAPIAPIQPSVGGVGAATEAPPPRQAARVATVTVKICVDDEEAARDEIWQKRLGDRLAAASEITEKTAGVRFAAVEFAKWNSDDAVRDFSRTFREFEQKVDGGKARLTIGFSSQYEIPRGSVHLGGTRGPLHPYILVREWSRHISEPERMEVLVHEIGHYLGAVHSGDADSVMRPKLGDRRSRSVKFEIRFDDANAQVMRLLGDEMRLRPVRRLAEVSDRTKSELLERYDALAAANPKDPAVQQHIKLVELAGGRR